MKLRPATLDDCHAIAELAQIAGDNIPGYFWADSQRPGQSLIDAGAEQASSADANFSYRNVLLACDGDEVAAMLLAYRLPAAGDNEDDPLDFPEFVRPLVELELCVPESFYINMLAAYPWYRGRGAGSALMAEVDRLAQAANCKLISIEVFANNTGALRLYHRLGYRQAKSLPMVASAYHPADDILLLTRTPSSG